jgi:predicted SnoaL-like aldol condensation-catalyzing enzyme
LILEVKPEIYETMCTTRSFWTITALLLVYFVYMKYVTDPGWFRRFWHDFWRFGRGSSFDDDGDWESEWERMMLDD